MSGLYYEDFAVGDEFITPSRTVTEADIVLFAGLSGDYNPLHTDEEFAKQTPFGGRIAHGLLGLSIASGLQARLGVLDGTVIAFLGLTWSFKGPVRAGDTIKLRMKTVEKRASSKPGRGVVKFALSVVNHRGDVVQEGEQVIMLVAKEAGANRV